MNTFLRFILIAFVAIFVVGCERASNQVENDKVQIELTVMPDPPVVGESQLEIKLSDKSGQPIEDAILNIKGDMTHAGMTPFLAEISGGADGIYETPFAWSMGGDWIINVDVQLRDGTMVSKQFDFTVTMGEGEMDAMDDS